MNLTLAVDGGGGDRKETGIPAVSKSKESSDSWRVAFGQGRRRQRQRVKGRESSAR